MRMREGTRRWAIRIAWGVLIVALSMLAGLRIGRPIFYTDGRTTVNARELAAAGMVRWQTPEVVAELPGPVQGRVTALPDGRLVYGRSTADGTSDLVVWDPQRPAVPPEPAYGLNTEHNELAPALGPDGRFYFASDRPAGVGGYDLYVAPWGAGGFGTPLPLAACNTALDETDPAPNDNGQDFVFVRIDRTVDGGNDGVLLRWRLGDELDPRPVFAGDAPRRRPRTVDRDPAFSPGGGALWFVRRVPGEPLRLVRASLLLGAFAAPLSVGERWGTGELRAPLPSADGLHLSLLQPRRGEAAADLWFSAAAAEVYPWWPGQRWLEWTLAGLVVACLLLLLLLHLGRRWSTLDLVAQCLLLSLLLHILLFLWLMGVEITGALLPGNDDGSGMQVSVITAAAASTSASGQQQDELAARVQFAPDERALAADAPSSATERATTAALVGPEGQWARDAAARPVETSAVVQDAAVEAAARAGSDATATPVAAELHAVERAAIVGKAAQAAQRAGAAVEAVQVIAPAATVARAGVTADALAPAGSLAALPTSSLRTLATDTPTIRDEREATGAAVAVRAGSDVPAAPGRAAASALGVTPAAAAGPRAEREVAAAGAVPNVLTPNADVERAVRGTLAVPTPAAASALATPTPHAATVRMPLREVPAAAVAVRGDASAAASVPVTPLAATLTGPSAATLSAEHRAEATGVQPEPAMPLAAPASALPRGDTRVGSLAPPAASARATPMPHALAVRMPLREGPAGAAAVRGDAVAAAPVPVTPLVATLTGPSAAQGSAPRRADTAGVRPEPAMPVAAPASALARGDTRIGADAARAVPAHAAATAHRSTAPTALRDGAGRADATRPQPATVAGPAERSTAAGALDVRVRAPVSQAIERPRRAGTSGAFAAPLPSASPPRSLLERAVPAPARGPEVLASAPANAYSNRFGPAKAKALEQFGGTVDTERAVANGLRYLARLQQPDGTWGDRSDFDAKYGHVYVGKTALCMLAFLGAGHTPVSGTEHSTVVAQALAHLLSLQDEDTGAFGASSSYGHGITTYAIAECYGLTKAPELLRPIENALTWILQHQGPRRDKRNRGGFGYFSPGLQPEDDYARVSVTAWMVMALESARLSGIDLPTEVLPRAREFLEQSFDQQNGWFRYNQKPSRLQSAWPTLPASTPAGAFCLMLLGAPTDDAMVHAAVDYTVQRRPEEYRRYDDDDFVLHGQGNVYFWYYGSLCCFLAGGEPWARWNERLRTVLPQAQSADGSFAPIDVYAREAGDTRTERSYTTAMCVLSLEVYYRYFTPLLLGR